MTRIKSLTRVLSIFAVLSLLFGSAINVTSVSANIITVTNTNDSGAGSLRQAILDADPDDTIKFDSSLSGEVIYSGEPLNIDKNLVIDGSALAVPITIDGGGSQSVFYVGNTVSGVVATLDSLIIQNGFSMMGGGIYNYGGTLTVTDSTFSGNSADYGGGIMNDQGTLTVTNSTFSGNSAIYGGGICNYYGGTLTVTNSTFSGNSAIYGGGIYNSGETLTVTDSTFSGNSSDFGGGIWTSSGTLTVTNSTFSGNSAGERGGGIANSGGTLTVTDSTFSGNSAIYGGGIMNTGGGTLIVTNSTFSGNSADEQGGGIAKFGGTLTVTDSTFSGNSSDFGGGIWNSSGTLTVTNSTFSGNSAIYGGGIINSGTLTVTNSTFSGNSAVVGDWWGGGGGIYNSSNGTLNYVNTIIANSMTGGDCVNDGAIGTNLKNWVADDSCDAEFSGDPLLGPLADNGGSTQTHALLIGSGAIDKGDNLLCPATDQRGVTRPQGAGCDIGSYEYTLFVYLPMVLK